ncbi:MAG: AraC family transcriptional regulator [Lachnospiraceae bacterium]|nr:AraC family transcriptional regulator [Lachnospiraceae bacterium]
MFHIGYCDYNRFNPDYDKIDRPEGSGDYLFLYFMTPMKVQTEVDITVTKEGAFMLYTPGAPQIYQAVKRFKNSFVHFTCNDDSFLKTYDLPVNRIVYLPDPDAMNALLQHIYVESVGKREHYEEQLDKLMHLLFILFSRQLHTYPKEADFSANLYEHFMKARIEILTHIDKEWSVDNMAALTNLGTSQFYNYYKLFFNRSPKSELLEARIERAKYLLRVEKLPVGQAAVQAGFSNVSHFTRYFKKECGMTPTEYGREKSG